MITPDYVRLMARYNTWQNKNIFGAAEHLTDDVRKQDGGAFFGSIQRTLSHLYWGDCVWMHRFYGLEKPDANIAESPDFVREWRILSDLRTALDQKIEEWAAHVDPAWIGSEISWYSGATQRQLTKPAASLAVHFFNHQTHHRGQVHALLTRFGARPTDTDLAFMP